MPQSDNSDVSDRVIAEVASQIATGEAPALNALFRKATLDPPEIALDPPLDMLPDPRLRSLAEQWRSWPKKDGVPLAAAVDPLEFVPALGIVMLLKVLEEGRDYEYLVYGADVTSGFGQSMVGRRTRDIPMPAAVRALFLGGYGAAIRVRRALYTRHQAPPGVSVSHWSRLILPLADEEGQIVRLLVGNAPGPKRRGLDRPG